MAMLLNRIKLVLNPLLRPNQNGFRQIRTTVEQIQDNTNLIVSLFSVKSYCVRLFLL